MNTFVHTVTAELLQLYMNMYSTYFLYPYQHLWLLIVSCIHVRIYIICVPRPSTAGNLYGDGDSTGASLMAPNQMSRPQQEEDEIAEALKDVRM